MNEACMNLFGEGIASEKGQKFAVDVLDFMRDRLEQYQEETGNIYNLEGDYFLIASGEIIKNTSSPFKRIKIKGVYHKSPDYIRDMDSVVGDEISLHSKNIYIDKTGD